MTTARPSGPAFHLGIDVGGTKVLGVAVEPGSPTVVRAEAERPTEAGRAVLGVIDAVIDDLLDALADVLGGAAPVLAGIGVGMPGFVDLAGVLTYGPNLPGAEELDVRAWLEPRRGVPVRVDNDGNCAAWAEHRLAPVPDLVFVGLGTGISSGLVVAGQRVRGVHGFAAEPGHMTLLPGGPRCACGRDGCWEALASGTALAAQARAAAHAEPERAGPLLARAGSIEGLDGRHVSDALRAGDPLATSIADRFAGWVAAGIVNLVQLLDPALVVVGGSVVADGELWLGRIRAGCAARSVGGVRRPRTRIVAARLGRRAGAIGAAQLTLL